MMNWIYSICRPVMPPEHYFEEEAHINEYTDGSGYLVDFDLWYPGGRRLICAASTVRGTGQPDTGGLWRVQRIRAGAEKALPYKEDSERRRRPHG